MAKVIKWLLIIGGTVITGAIIVIYAVLSSYDFNDLKQPLTQAVYKATGRKLTIGGDIGLDIGLQPALVLDDITFANATWGSRPELVKIKRFEVQVALIPLLGRQIAIKRLIMIDPDIVIESDVSGKSNLELRPEDVPAATDEQESVAEAVTMPAFTFEKLRIRNGRLTFKNGRTGNILIILLDRLNTGAASIDSPLLIDLQGSVDHKSFNVTGELGSLSALMDAEQDWPFHVTIKGAEAVVTLTGKIKDVFAQKGLDVDFTVDINDLARTAGQAGFEVPINQPVTVSGKITDSGVDSYKIEDFKMNAGASDLGGNLEISLAGERPRLVAVVTSNRFDIRRFLPGNIAERQPETKTTKVLPKQDKVFSATPLPFEVLKTIDGELGFKADRVLLPRLAANNVTATISLDNGQVSVRPLKAIIGGGTMELTATIDAAGSPVLLASKLKIDGLELGAMLRELEITDMVEGGLDADIALKSRGRSMAALMAALSGHTVIVMADGRINNKYVNLLGADLGSGVFRLLNPVAEQEDYTNVNCLVSRFDIRKGIAACTVLVFDTDQMSVTGDGNLDFGAERLDLSLRPQPKDSLAQTGISFSLGELAKPFKLGGTFVKPSLALDPTRAASTLGKAVGGAAKFGYAGIAAALVTDKKEDQNPCRTAMEAVTGDTTAFKPAKKSTLSQPETEIEQNVKEIGGVLQGLFGK